MGILDQCVMWQPITWCLIQIAVPCSSYCSFLIQILFLLCNVTHHHRRCCHVHKPSYRNNMEYTRDCIYTFMSSLVSRACPKWLLISCFDFSYFTYLLLPDIKPHIFCCSFLTQPNDSLKIPSKGGNPLSPRDPVSYPTGWATHLRP